MFSQTLKNYLENLLDAGIANINSISGGSINKAAKIETEQGKCFFLKWNSTAPSDMFPKEKKGLEQLATAETGLRLPNVVEIGQKAGVSYILMEYIEEKREEGKSSQQFGKALAKLHKTTTDQFGLEYDNYIGRLEQPNNQTDDWIDFLVEQRLGVQLKKALNAGKLSRKTLEHFQQLYKKLPSLLPKEPASLLHGDLWSGNYFFDEKGNAAIFDPAVYYGNREIEIAFTHLFGGFSSGFYEAYNHAFPLEPNFNERKDIYNLYPLLVHTNMFGGHYARQVKSIVKQFV